MRKPNKLTINALLGLLNESLTEDVPGQILGYAIHLRFAGMNEKMSKNLLLETMPFHHQGSHLLQSLVYGHCAHGNRTVADNPLPRLVNVLPGA